MIRRYLTRAAVAVALLGAAPAFAQAPAPAPAAPATAPVAPPAVAPSHLQAGRELVDLTGVGTSFDIFKDFTDNTRQIVGTTRPELSKDMNEVFALLKPEADKRKDEILNIAAGFFAKKLSEADMKELNTFFRSPVAQRYTIARGEAVSELFDALQPWSVQTANFLFERFSQEMRKRGHQL